MYYLFYTFVLYILFLIFELANLVWIFFVLGSSMNTQVSDEIEILKSRANHHEMIANNLYLKKNHSFILKPPNLIGKNIKSHHMKQRSFIISIRFFIFKSLEVLHLSLYPNLNFNSKRIFPLDIISIFGDVVYTSERTN